MFALRKNGVTPIRRCGKIFQQRHQLAAGNFRLHLPTCCATPCRNPPNTNRAALGRLSSPADLPAANKSHCAHRQRWAAERPAPRLRGAARQRQAVKPAQLAGVQRRTVRLEVSRRGHAQPPVVRQPHTHQARIRHIAHPHRAVKALTGDVNHAVRQIERQCHIAVQSAKFGHQRYRPIMAGATPPPAPQPSNCCA